MGAGLEPLREVVTSSSSAASSSQSFQNVLQLLQQSNSLIAVPRQDQSHGPPVRLGQSRDRGQDSRTDASVTAEAVSGRSEGSVGSGSTFDTRVGSGSTFDTRDEVDFCNGLAALDASIASLQRSIKLDLFT